MEQFNKSKGERASLSLFLWISLVVGIILSTVFGSVDDSYEGLFQSGAVETLRGGTFDKKEFLIHVLFSRLSYVVTVILLSTTSFRRMFLMLQPILLSLGAGAWIGAAISEYGIKGILLVLAGAFPHMLLYLLMLRFLIMLLWDRTYYDKQFFIAVLVLLFITVIGCLLESYVNPLVIAKILKIF